MAVSALRCVIDTSAFSEFERGKAPKLRPIFRAHTELVMSLIVVGELRAGYAAGNHQAHNESLLRRFLDRPNVTIYYLSEQTTSYYGQIYADLKKIGKPINTNDMWIAALCLEHKLPLLTLDKHFSAIPNLELVKI